ncbi:MAG: hypothetical protein GTN81_01405 [Proteobacteria bacterium]|nr:hypothetical protein [Pseudomonadota bacterium]
MTKKNVEKPLREVLTTPLTKIRPFFDALTPDLMKAELVQEVSEKIGNLWLMIAMTS